MSEYTVDIYTDEETGCKVKIVNDPYPESPREWSNVFSLCLKSRNYTLVEEDIDPWIEAARERIVERLDDLEDLRNVDGMTFDDIAAEKEGLTVDGPYGRVERNPTLAEVEEEFNGRIFPVYAYEHGQIGLSTSRNRYPFDCPWDGGQLGFALVSNAKIQEEFLNYYSDGRWVYAEHPSTEKIDHGDVNDWLYAMLSQELSNLEDYWNGNVYCLEEEFPDGTNGWAHGCDTGFCGIYDSDGWKEDGYLRTEARNLLALIVQVWKDEQLDGILAMDQFDQADLMLAGS